jgi:hypothetical protein
VASIVWFRLPKEFAKEGVMTRRPFALSRLAFVVALLTPATAQSAVRTTFPAQNPGPPFYAFLDRPPVGEIFRDGDWVAIPFVRDPSCIPPDFNLLDSADIPRAFGCELTVKGFALWKNGPPPIDPVPIQAYYSGLGAVPVWFVTWTDLQAAIADDELTTAELQSLPSLIIGSASFFEAVEQPVRCGPRASATARLK